MKRLLSILLFSGVLLVVGCKKEEPEDEKIPPVTSVGAFYQGGIVVHVDDSGQHGLIITEHDIDTCKWTNESSNYKRIFSNEFMESHFNENYSNYMYKGDIFTQKIVDSLGAGVYAAKVCHDLVLNGYSDWFLPSLGDLHEVTRSKVFDSNTQADGLYWCSMESNINVSYANTWVLKGNTIHSSKTKNLGLPVRAMRKF